MNMKCCSKVIFMLSYLLVFCKPFKSNNTLFVRNFLTRSKYIRSLNMNSLNFDNKNLRELPVDSINDNYCRQVPNAIFSKVNPTPVVNPSLVSASTSALALLDLDGTDKDKLARYFSGNEKFAGSETYSHCYCGHQFGSFAGQLGDGAAIALGEIINHNGERWEIQLKGAGKTPYSRSADGRKVLRSSIREYLCSEAMNFLNIPTTRAATCVTSETTVERDPLYDGHVIDEKCTIVSRIAPNFFRVGSFEIFKKNKESDGRSGPSAGNIPLLRKLVTHVISNFYPDIWNKRTLYTGSDSNIVTTQALNMLTKEFLYEVIERTAKLAAKWQSVGFVHGVLNTDNISIMGITIDYGPFGFMEYFDPDFIPNGSDGTGRYSYINQPNACRWVMTKLYEALLPTLDNYNNLNDNNNEDVVSIKSVENYFDDIYTKEYNRIMHEKLGLLTYHVDDEILFKSLFDTMTKCHTDFTETFLILSSLSLDNIESTFSLSEKEEQKNKLINMLVNSSASPKIILDSYKRKLKIAGRLSMAPQQIMQFWNILQQSPETIRETFGDYPIEDLRSEITGEKKKLDLLMEASDKIKRLQEASPDDKIIEDREIWRLWIDKYIQRLQIEYISNDVDIQTRRENMMKSINPTFILRNWVAQEAIKDAEDGDYNAVNLVLEMLSTPYEESFNTKSNAIVNNSISCNMNINKNNKESLSSDKTLAYRRFLGTAPDWAAGLICTCSS